MRGKRNTNGSKRGFGYMRCLEIFLSHNKLKSSPKSADIGMVW